MGRIKYISPSDEIAGTIGGVTYARAYGVQTVRAYRVPVNKRTDAQRQRRRTLASYSSQWFESLSSAQRTNWDTYAATVPFADSLGKTYYLNGFNMFTRTQCILFNFSVPENFTAPLTSGLPTTRDMNPGLVHATGVLSIDNLDPPGVATDRLLFRVFNFQKITRNFFSRRTQLFFDCDAATAEPYTIYTYGALPGVSGDYAAWFEFRYLDFTNRITNPILFKVISV